MTKLAEHPVHIPDHLDRSINWKQGLAIALGVPLLILPSLGYIPLYLSAAAILIWGLSVLQGFIQNTAYAELACTFPEASGLPGCAQHVFTTEGYEGKVDKGKLLGGFTAWRSTTACRGFPRWCLGWWWRQQSG